MSYFTGTSGIIMKFEVSPGGVKDYRAFIENNPKGYVLLDVISPQKEKIVLVVSHHGAFIEPCDWALADAYVCCEPQKLTRHYRAKHVFPDHSGVVRATTYKDENCIYFLEVNPV